jgi:glycosyltransferase involved in cell wall biosynthesis
MAIFAERWCYRPTRTRAVIAVSAGVDGEVRRHFPDLADRIHMIPHGVDSHRFRFDPVARRVVRAQYNFAPDDLVAVFVGGDWKRKGLAHAIAAVALTDRWNLMVVGRGYPPAYEEQAEKLGVGGRVHFAGETDDVPAHLAAGDVFLLPTEYETFCLVAFEAAAVGLPVLVTPVSGPEVLIDPGVNGEFLDSDIGRTARLLDAYVDGHRRRGHGLAARERARLFTWSEALAAHIDLYQRLES